MKLFAGMTVVLVLAGAGCSRDTGRSSTGGSLHIYNWASYIGPTTLSDFEKEFGVTITYDNFSSNDELLAKLQAGVSQYDVIVPTDYMVKIMIAQGLLAELDTANIPNRRNIEPRFRHLPYDPEERYAVPYQWGTTGIGYNAKLVRKPITGWRSLWDPSLSGHLTILDEARSGVVPAQKLLGFSVNTTDEAELRVVRDKILELKPALRAFSSSTYMDLLRTGDVWVSVGFSGDVYQVTKTHPDIHYVIPEEGTDIWFDNLAIPKNAPNKATAEAFINYILRPEVAAAIANATRYASPNREAKRFIDPGILADPAIYPPPEVLDRCEFLHDVGPATRLYDRIWSEIKSR